MAASKSLAGYIQLSSRWTLLLSAGPTDSALPTVAVITTGRYRGVIVGVIVIVGAGADADASGFVGSCVWSRARSKMIFGKPILQS